MKRLIVVRTIRSRAACLQFATFVTMTGYGAVIPYLYANIADARHMGGAAAAVTFVAFAIGALAATPVAGRLAEGRNPGGVAIVCRTVTAAMVVFIAFAPVASVLSFAALIYGAADAVALTASTVVLVHCTAATSRRDVFAWRVVAINLGIAAGGFIGGLLINLTTPTGMTRVYAVVVACELAAAAIQWAAVRTMRTETAALDVRAGKAPARLRDLLRVRPMPTVVAVTVLLTLACLAQYESGLPAYALTVLHTSPKTLGIGFAINALVVAALAPPVIAFSRRSNPTSLLGICAILWALSWATVGVPLMHVGSAGTLLIAGLVVMSLGETVMTPVLTPLATTLAPPEASGRAIAAVTGAQTAATLAGPPLSGVLLAIHAPAAFIALQIACCAASLHLVLRLRHAVSRDESGSATDLAQVNSASGRSAPR